MIKGQYGKKTKWSKAEIVKDQMLVAEMAKDKMGEDEVDINHKIMLDSFPDLTVEV